MMKDRITKWTTVLRIRLWQDRQRRSAAQRRGAEERSELRAKGVLKEGMPPSAS
jgi:hypothetical protein